MQKKKINGARSSQGRAATRGQGLDCCGVNVGGALTTGNQSDSMKRRDVAVGEKDEDDGGWARMQKERQPGRRTEARMREARGERNERGSKLVWNVLNLVSVNRQVGMRPGANASERLVEGAWESVGGREGDGLT